MSLWVIKIGTSLLRGNNNFNTYESINKYCSCIAEAMKTGDKIILVSSGAVGLGCNRLGIKGRPKEMTSLQAAAAVGQVNLMALYEKAMHKYGYKVAQILLTRTELGTRNSYQKASMTLKKLIEWNILPIVNENDTVSDEELKYGDNDTLSALVATAVSANQLILLTDIDHLYSSDPKTNDNAIPIKEIHNSQELETLNLAESSTAWGTGGIKTKLNAAKIATQSGITVQLADGRCHDNLKQLLNGSRKGTVFHPHSKPIRNRKSWLAHAIKPMGEILLDTGASEAIINKGASLLLVGIKTIKGNFQANQPVSIFNEDKVEIARGISSISSNEIRSWLKSPLSSEKSPIVIHRDVLVLTSELVEH